jgi:hypothetical protein
MQPARVMAQPGQLGRYGAQSHIRVVVSQFVFVPRHRVIQSLTHPLGHVGPSTVSSVALSYSGTGLAPSRSRVVA